MFFAFSELVSVSVLVGFISGGVVVVGIVLEGAELIVKWGRKKKFRNWVGEIFGEEKRRRIVSCVKYSKPKILPFESIGFAMIVAGLTVEWISGTTAEIMQSKENGELESTNVQLSLNVEELRKENNDFAIAQSPRQIDEFSLEQALEKIHGMNFIIVNSPDWEPNRLASSIEWGFKLPLQQLTYSRIVTALDIPDGIHIGFPTPPPIHLTNSLNMVGHEKKE